MSMTGFIVGFFAGLVCGLAAGILGTCLLKANSLKAQRRDDDSAEDLIRDRERAAKDPEFSLSEAIRAARLTN